MVTWCVRCSRSALEEGEGEVRDGHVMCQVLPQRPGGGGGGGQRWSRDASGAPAAPWRRGGGGQRWSRAVSGAPAAPWGEMGGGGGQRWSRAVSGAPAAPWRRRGGGQRWSRGASGAPAAPWRREEGEVRDGHVVCQVLPQRPGGGGGEVRDGHVVRQVLPQRPGGGGRGRSEMVTWCVRCSRSALGEIRQCADRTSPWNGRQVIITTCCANIYKCSEFECIYAIF